MMNGIIFDIKEFAVYDGTGVRQTVFFKGCPLRCNWCHNPEGLSVKKQLMVSSGTCIHCGKCSEVCTHKTCIACGKCVGVCPRGLRKICGEKISSEELSARILKDAQYYKNLGGGVTFSGGEPLLQGEFLLEVINLIPDVHKAVQTCGYAKTELFEAVVSSLNLVMLDIKIVDSQLHKHYTGVDNALILQNLEFLCRNTIPFIIRIPVIPGVNDTEKNYRQTAKLICCAKALQGVELLPYHKTAGAKYSMVNMDYTPDFDINKSVRISQEIFTEYGIRSKVL